MFRYHDDNLFRKIALEKMEVVANTLVREDFKDGILILGSSHAQFAVNADLMSSQLGIECLNLAYGGGTVVGDQKALLEYWLLEHEAPATILYCVDVFSLNYEWPGKPSEYIEALVAKQDRVSYSFRSRLRGFKRSIPLASCAFRYGRNIPRYLKDIVGGKPTLPILQEQTYNLEMFSEYRSYSISPRGHVRGEGLLNPEFVRYDKYEFEPKKESIAFLDDVCKLASQNGIRLIFVQLPEHEVALAAHIKYLHFEKWMQDYSRSKQVPYFNYNGVDRFPVDTDQFFFDSDHLNQNGANLLTQKLLKDLGSLKLYRE